MVKVFQTFASDKQLLKLSADLVLEKAQTYYPKPSDPDYLRRNDVPWIRRFSKAGGKVIVSGNTLMKVNSHERLALVEEGMIVLFFENAWNQWGYFHKCSLLLHWWPMIVKQLKTAKPSSFWHIPATWPKTESAKLRSVPNHDLKLEKIERQKADQPRIRAERAAKRQKEQEADDLFKAADRRESSQNEAR
nr:hypothetical protein [Bradyrhizobium sp. 2S1]